MFDHLRSRPSLSDRLGLLIVLLVMLVGLAAVPLAAIDFQRPGPAGVARAPAPAVELATADTLGQ